MATQATGFHFDPLLYAVMNISELDGLYIQVVRRHSEWLTNKNFEIFCIAYDT